MYWRMHIEKCVPGTHREVSHCSRASNPLSPRGGKSLLPERVFNLCMTHRSDTSNNIQVWKVCHRFRHPRAGGRVESMIVPVCAGLEKQATRH